MGVIHMTKRGKPTTEIFGVPKPKLDGPTAEQLRNGDFGRRFTMHVETATEVMTHVSRHDPIERWKAAERLSDGQRAVIDLCQSLWRITEDRQFEKLTSTYGERLPGGGASKEIGILALRDAEQQLARIRGYFAGLEKWWHVFENVARHGMAAGVAGGVDRNGSNTAFTIVCFIADIIASKERV